MIPTRSIIFTLAMLFASNISFSQNEDVVTDSAISKNEKQTSSDTELILIDSLDSDGKTTSVGLVNPYQNRQRPSDKVFRKYLELNKKETRFDINFQQIDHYDYSSKKEDNLTLMQKEIPVYDRYTYYNPSFAESFLFEFALGLLGKK